MGIIDPKHYDLKNGQQITFRNLLGSDAQALLEFFQKIAEETNNTMRYVGMPLLTIEEQKASLEKQLNIKSSLMIGAFSEGCLVGYLNFRVPWENHIWVMHMASFGMMILKDYWGLGIGKALLEIQDDYARSIGVIRIEAMVRVKNHRGVQLYERNGFKIEGTRVMAAKIDGQYEDEYFIAKILK